MASIMRFDRWENTLGQGVGTVLQVVNVQMPNLLSGTNTSFADVAGLTATITPKFASSKILVSVSVNVGTNSDTDTRIYLKLDRNGTNIFPSSYDATFWTAYTSQYTMGHGSIEAFDTPATTSPVTYKVQSKGDGNTYFINRHMTSGGVNGSGISTITLMEIQV